MQGKSGFDVAAYLRDYCQVPFMFLSAFSDEQTGVQVKALGAVAYLVKPLDIGQILPVVAAALAAGRAGRLEASTRASAPPMPSPEVLMAVGVLMHRYSLTRAAAFERLHRLAQGEQRSIDAQAELLLNAVEVLALPAAP